MFLCFLYKPTCLLTHRSLIHCISLLFLLFLPVFDPFSKRNACLVTTFSIAIGSNVKSPPPASHVFTSKRSNRKWYRGESSQRGGFLLRSCFVYVFSFTVAVLFVSFLILFFFVNQSEAKKEDFTGTLFLRSVSSRVFMCDLCC